MLGTRLGKGNKNGGVTAIPGSNTPYSPGHGTLVGFNAGVLVGYSVILFDNIKLDDSASAIFLHLTCGN
jgi:hypothetical protein